MVVNVDNMSIQDLNKLIKKNRVFGFITKPKAIKVELVKLIKTPVKELKAKAEKDYGVDIKKHKKKADILNQIGKKLRGLNNADAVGKDVIIPFDMYRFGKHVRVITNINSIEGFYDRVKAYRQQYLAEGYTMYLVTAYFKLRVSEAGKAGVLYRHINYENYFFDLEELTKWFDDIKNTPNNIAEGSDGIEDDRYVPDFSRFDLILNKVDVEGNGGGFTDKFFKTIELGKYDKGYCGFSCLKTILGDKITKEEYDKKKLKNLDNLINYIKYNNLPIKVIGNYIKLTKIIEDNKFIKTKVGNKNVGLYKLVSEDIRVPIYNDVMDPKYYIIYDLDKEHYETTEKLELDNIYCGQAFMFYREANGEITQMCKPTKNNDKLVQYGLVKNLSYDVEFIIFDYETITDWKELNVNKAYSLNILRCGIKDLMKLELIECTNSDKKELLIILKKVSNTDEKNDILKKLINLIGGMRNEENKEEFIVEYIKKNGLKQEAIIEELETQIKTNFDEFVKNHSRSFVGYDCTKQFLTYIQENQANKVFYFTSFNGSNFDNYILYNDCIKFGVDNLGAPLITNGQLLNFKLFGRHTMLDIRKHVGGSLIENCYSFKIDLCKKIEGFSHYEMQKKYDSGELEEFIKTSEELKKYNMYDCLSLALIFFRYKTACEEIPGFEKYKIEQNITLGMLMMRKFNDHLTSKQIALPKFTISKQEFMKKFGRKFENKDLKDLEKKVDEVNKRLMQYYKDIAANRVAGRVELFNCRQKIEEAIASLDVCSLYPYVMFIAPNYYPAGDVVEVEKYSDKPKNLIGYFYCDVDQSNMSVNILAQKTKDGNDWKAKKLKNVFISSVMIEYLLKCGAKVETRNGIYFTEIVKGCELFSFLLEIMKLKNGQDVLKEKKLKEYNPVMREIYKLMLNILSGKLNQKLNNAERKILNCHEFLEMQRNNKIKQINTIMIVGDKAHVTYDKDDEDCIKNGKPICVGSMIYDYAKIYMHENMYTKVPLWVLIYTDTDSNKLRLKDFEMWRAYGEKQMVPHWPEVEKYDERYKTHKLYAPNSKVFGSFEDEYKGNNNNLSYFEQKKTYLCVDTTLQERLNKMVFENERDRQIYIKKYVSFHFKGISQKDIVINDDDISDEPSFEELNDIYNDPESKRIKDDYIGFFEMLHTTNKAKVLTCSLQRISNNLKKNTTMDQPERMNNKCYNIVTSYRIKNLTIK